MNLDTEKYLAPLRKENNAPVTGSQVESAPAGDKVCRAVLIHPFTDEENADGDHHVFIDLLDENGERFPAGGGWFVRHGWDNMRPDEMPDPAPFEKQPPEPVANVPIHGGASVWISILSYGDSDRVKGLASRNGHSSWYIVFQRQEAATVKPPVDVGFVTIAKKKVREVLRLLAAGEDLAAIVQVEEWLQ